MEAHTRLTGGLAPDHGQDDFGMNKEEGVMRAMAEHHEIHNDPMAAGVFPRR